MAHERVVAIGYDHPSLAGHFPGHPIVPGVILLNEVIETLRHAITVPLRVTGLPIVKFAVPLKPGEDVIIRVEEETGGRASFSCLAATRLIASGVIEFTVGMSAETERA